MADNPPALEQHHCDAGANFVRIDLRPDACAGSVNAYRKKSTSDSVVNCQRMFKRLARNRAASPMDGEEKGEGCSQRVVCPKGAKPSP